MVAAPDSHEIGLSVVTGTGNGSLNSHLHGDFDGNRSGVGEENVVHGLWRHSEECLTKIYGRTMGKSAEHDVAHLVELAAYSVV